MKEILIESDHGRDRLALAEDGKLLEIYADQDGGRLQGRIYLGRVMNVLPGMQAAFVDIGLEKNDVFLQKTERQLRTLHEKARELQGYSSLLSAYGVLRRLHLAGAMKALHTWLQKFERRNLLSPQPSIWVFQLYKLGYYASIQ